MEFLILDFEGYSIIDIIFCIEFDRKSSSSFNFTRPAYPRSGLVQFKIAAAQHLLITDRFPIEIKTEIGDLIIHYGVKPSKNAFVI